MPKFIIFSLAPCDRLLFEICALCREHYFRRFDRYAFTDCKCIDKKQFEASIIRLYHVIEKGLSYTENYKPGFGRDNIIKLIVSLEQYSEKHDVQVDFYETALSCLNAYVEKNKEYGFVDEEINERITKLPGKANDKGGIISVSRPDEGKMNLEELLTSGHSIRFFSDRPVDLNKVKHAISLAQFTPSACNRQGWRTLIVDNKAKMKEILKNQHGNRGFGNQFDKLLIVTSDIRCFQRGRETFQLFIDGGMYAQNILNSLYYYGIGCVPLSASLTIEQEKEVKTITGITDSEELILFIGIGNYPDTPIFTTKSERHKPLIEIID